MGRPGHFISRVLCWTVLLVFAFGMLAFWENGALAQQKNENAPAPAEPAADDANSDDAGDEKKSLGMLIVQSGWVSVIFYVLLGIFSIVALMVVLERLINLTRSKVMPPEFARSVQDASVSGNATAEDFRRLSESSNSPIARILKAGVLRVGRPLMEVEKTMEDAVVREMATLRSKTKSLAVIGNVAPLVGLLGTVVGIMFAFNSASERGLGGGEQMAKGIYLALLTTAAGLTVAIPCMLFSAWFNGKAERYMRDIDECLQDTMPCFAQMENRIISHRITTNEADRADSPVAEAVGAS